MEDQQPAAGDLTAEENPAADQNEATVAAAGDDWENGDAATESEAAETSDAEPADGAEDTQSAETVETAGAAPAAGGRTKRLAGKAWAVAAMVAALLFVGSARFAGAMVQPYLADRAVAATKLKVARTAANAITTLWTYTPENMDTLADRASAYLSGDFEA